MHFRNVSHPIEIEGRLGRRKPQVLVMGVDHNAGSQLMERVFETRVDGTPLHRHFGNAAFLSGYSPANPRSLRRMWEDVRRLAESLKEGSANVAGFSKRDGRAVGGQISTILSRDRPGYPDLTDSQWQLWGKAVKENLGETVYPDLKAIDGAIDGLPHAPQFVVKVFAFEKERANQPVLVVGPAEMRDIVESAQKATGEPVIFLPPRGLITLVGGLDPKKFSEFLEEIQKNRSKLPKISGAHHGLAVRLPFSFGYNSPSAGKHWNALRALGVGELEIMGLQASPIRRTALAESHQHARFLHALVSQLAASNNAEK
ncbi:hypothetical protein HY095_03515 [Candidatus Micrarchaeota archaeon]|nr:hypothetical protein [Candidatus Micrarchaeota archaeon]